MAIATLRANAERAASDSNVHHGLVSRNVFPAFLHSLAVLRSNSGFWATCGLGGPSTRTLGNPSTRLRHPGPQGTISPSALFATNRDDPCEFQRQWPALRVLRSPVWTDPGLSGDMTTGPQPALLQTCVPGAEVKPVAPADQKHVTKSLDQKDQPGLCGDGTLWGTRAAPQGGAAAAPVRPHREPGPGASGPGHGRSGALRGPPRPHRPAGPAPRLPSGARPGSRRAR